MKFYINNKFLSIGGSSEVLDESGNKVYKVKGRMFSPTKVKKIFDMNGKLLYKVRNKFWRFLKNYILIYGANKNVIGKLTTPKVIGRSFVLLDYEEEIALTSQNGTLQITSGEKLIAVMKYKMAMATDKFELEVLDENYKDLCIALVIAVDNYRDKIRRDTTSH